MTREVLSDQALMEITSRPPAVFVRGEGSWLWDAAGKRYLDFVQGWAVNAFGHCPPFIASVLSRQSRTLNTPGPAYYNQPAMELAARIVAHSGFDRVFFTNSGAESNEGAIKLARKWGARHKGGAFEIITFDNAFHGRTLATMSASGKPQFRNLFEPKVPGFPKAVLNDIESVERLIASHTVAVMLEPIQGEAGVHLATDDFLRDLRNLTRERQLLLIVDEVQTGVGRTGKLWGHQHAGIDPDIMTLGKMLGGGVPLGALVATEAVSCFEHGDQGGTFNGNPLMTAVGCAVLDAVLAAGVLEEVTARGRYLGGQLTEFARRRGLKGVRGRGLLLALDLGRDIGKRVAATARELGLLVDTPRSHLLRFMPALNVSRDEIDTMASLLDEAVARCQSAVDTGASPAGTRSRE
jgi:acetylornithine/N-succinyldiaminopimelate aminotransferase